MMNREVRFQRLLRAYPRSYREERGEEIIGFLLEASAAGDDVMTRDAADIVVHGFQLRLGLTSERFAGRVLALAAAPGLVMGAVFALAMFVFGEWLPVVTGAPILLRFGPFWTIGPVVYLVWVLAATGALLWPQWQRLLAAVGVVVALAAVPVGDLVGARPNLWVLLLLVELGLPAVLAPATDGGRANRRVAVGAGLVTGVVLGLLAQSMVTPGSRFFPSFYWWGGWAIGRDLPWVAAAGVVVVGGLVVFRRAEVAGAVSVLLVAWTAVNGFSSYGMTTADTVNVVAAFGFGAWLVVLWMVDLRRIAVGTAGVA